MFSIVGVFLLTAWYGGAAACSCAVAVAGVGIGLCVWLRKTTNVTVRLMMAVFVCGCVVGYGHGRNWLPSLSNHAGAHLLATGTVTSSYPSRQGVNAWVQLDEVWIEGKRFNTSISVKVHDATRSSAVKGDAVRLDGMVVHPYSPQPSSPDVAVMGHMVSDTAAKPPHSVTDTMQAALVRNGGLAEPTAMLVNSLVFGGASNLPPGIHNDFLAAGLSHVLAASGANLLIAQTVFAALVRPLWRRSRFPVALWVCVQCLFSWGYTALCSFQVSMVRAALMSNYRFVGIGLSRRPTTQGGLLLAGIVFVAWDPGASLGVGTLLSFAATAAVAAALHPAPAKHTRDSVPRWRRCVRVVVRCVLMSLRTTMWVEAFVLPITSNVFHQWTPYALISNILVDPLLFLLLPLSFLAIGATLAASFVSVTLFGWLAHAACIVLGLGMIVLEQLVHRVAALPFAMVPLPASTTGWICALYAAVGLWWWMRKQKWTRMRRNQRFRGKSV